MSTCSICHFETELDDVVIRSGLARCVCLSCYGRATNTILKMPRRLRYEIGAALNALEPV